MWLFVSKGHSGKHHMHQSAPYKLYLERKMDQKEESLVKDICRYAELCSSGSSLLGAEVSTVLHFHQVTHLQEDETHAEPWLHSSWDILSVEGLSDSLAVSNLHQSHRRPTAALCA